MQSPPTRRKFKPIRLLLLAGVAVVAGSGLFFFHKVQVKAQANTLLQRASGAEEKGDWQEAANFYRTYLSLRSNDADVVAKYGAALEAEGEKRPRSYFEAVDVYERLLRMNAYKHDERRKLARIYLDKHNNTSSAREHLRFLLNPGEGNQADDPELLEMFARCELDEKKTKEATKYLEKAVASGKASADATLRLARLVKAQDDSAETVERADNLMNDLVKARPDDIKARLARAEYRADGGDLKGANADIEHAFHLPGGAKNPTVILARARVAMMEKDWPTAEKVLAAGAADLPDNTDIQLLWATVLAEERKPDDAKKIYRLLVEKRTQADALLVEIVDRLIDLGDFDAPLVQADKFAADTTPGIKAFADYLRGRVRLAEGNWPEALRYLEVAADGLTRTPLFKLRAQLGIGQCYAFANNPDRELAAYSAALQTAPSSPDARLGLADALAKLGKIQQAIDAFEMAVVEKPGARAPLCRLRLADVMARPASQRNWGLLEKAYGKAPYPPEVEVVRANALYFQNQPAEAEAVLVETIARVSDAPQPRVALAILRAGKNPDAGLKELEEAKTLTRDIVDYRLAKAQILGRKSDADAKPILALANETGSFGQRDRYRLWSGLAQMLSSLGKRADAIELYTKAAGEVKYDLQVRAALFDLAVAEKKPDLQDKVLGEIAQIEGPDGPTRLVAEATRALVAVPSGQKVNTGPVRDKLLAARAKRASWGRVYALLGDVDLIDNQPDAALQNYRKAMEFGEQTDMLVRRTIRILLDRQYNKEALDLLEKLNREVTLSPEMMKQLMLIRTTFSAEGAAKGKDWAESEPAAGSTDYRDHLTRATIFVLNGLNDKARGSLEKAVSLGEKSPETWVALVRFLSATGKQPEAESAYKRAAEKLDPKSTADNLTTCLALGACLELLGNQPEAEKMYRAAHARAATDPGAIRQLHMLLQQTGRKAEADDLLRKAMDNPESNPAVRRWARRLLAFSMVSEADGHAKLKPALDLIETNLAEGKNLLDDERAKALLVAFDPFQRADAIKRLTDSAATTPLAPEESFILAKLLMQNGQLGAAEDALKDATRAASLSSPEHLGLLVRVQLMKGPGEVAAAKRTIDQMKLVAPNGWDTIAAEARYLATVGKKDEAGKLVLGGPLQDDPGHLLTQVGPLLEEVHYPDDAEKAYRRYLDVAKGPEAHVPLTSFYLRAGRGMDAIGTARKYQQGCPVGLTGRLMSGGVMVRPADTIPPAEADEWKKTVAEVTTWVAEKLQTNPKDIGLLFAKAELADADKRYPEAIDAYETALTIAPENEVFMNNLAILLVLARKDPSPRPLELVNKAIARKGPQPHFLDTRAVVYLAADKVAEATKDLDVAISLNPRPAFYFHLAETYDKDHNTQARDGAIAQAKQRGLTKRMLHPTEWPEFERLIGSPR